MTSIQTIPTGWELEAKARAFAYKRHGDVGHFRKTTFAPYVYHLEEVALLVKQAEVWDYAMVAAALCHDVVEDTPTTIEEVRAELGDDVAYLVAGLTDLSKPEDGKRDVRKAIDRAHVAAGCWRIQTIKYCDTISNTRDILKNDVGFARTYLPEIRQLLAECTKGDAGLRARALDSANQEIPMGGNALKLSDAARINAEEYASLKHKIWMSMMDAMPNAVVVPIEAYRRKPDFGDIDILVENPPSNHRELLYSVFNATEVISNGNVLSYGYPLGDGRVFQVDVIKSATLDWSFVYFSFNDLGNLMGRISKKLGFKYGHDGLWYILRDPENETRVIEELLVTNKYEDLVKAFELIGYDYNVWSNWPFVDVEHLYQYAASNRYFDHEIYKLENRPHHERMRDRKRKVYVGFLEWCGKQTFPEVPDEYKDVPTLRATKLKEAFEKFPDFEKAYSRAVVMDKMKRAAKLMTNHEFIKEVTGAVGKQIGVVLGEFKKPWSTLNDDHYYHWCNTVGTEEVQTTFREWWAKASKEDSEMMRLFNLHAANMAKANKQ